MKPRFFVLMFAVAIGSVVSGTAQVVIHESATLGPIGQFGGLNFNPNRFLGSRFSLTQTVQVTAVGGHLGRNNGELFAAIVSLSSPIALPVGSPFNPNEVVAFATFSEPRSGAGSDDILVPLNVTLDPGDYGLVFGSGEFGTGGMGFMPQSNTDISGQASYFMWTGGWQDPGFSDIRFVVVGFITSSCSIDLTPDLEGTTLNLDFALSSAEPTTWNVWMSFQNLTFPLWNVPIPALEALISFPIPAFPQAGRVGFLTTLTNADGILCSDWVTIETGTPAE